MKKILCLTLALLAMLACLTSCNFNIQSAISDKATSKEQAQEMMNHLSARRMTDAVSLMHPEKSNGTQLALGQIATYLNGRKATKMEVVGVNLTSSVGTAGSTSQEQVSYKVNLNDGSVVYLSTVYLKNAAGEGFVSFQMVLGVV